MGVLLFFLEFLQAPVLTLMLIDSQVFEGMTVFLMFDLITLETRFGLSYPMSAPGEVSLGRSR